MLPFAIYDVFSDRAYAGNQLAVVHDGQALGPDQMQAIAQEFGYSETVFTLPPTVDGAHYRARIFTPAEELPFAGHPTIGAALAMTQSGRITPDSGTVVQECAAGLMTLTVDAATATLTSTVLSTGADIDPAVAAAAIGLDPTRVIGRPGAASAGYAHNFVRVADTDVTAATAHLGALDKVYVFAYDPDTGAVHARLFHDGVGEDPATGSAALALGAHLAATGLVGEGAHRFTIAQGAEIGRPSRLLGEVTVEGGQAVSVSVTGAAVKVAEGTLVALPK